MSEHSTRMHRIETTENYGDIYEAVRRYVQDNNHERITLNDYVRQSGYSMRQVQRALSWYSTNWQRMLLDERMKRARTLLANTNDTISRVAEQVGYDHSQFTRTFKAEEGLTPEEYRDDIRRAQMGA